MMKVFFKLVQLLLLTTLLAASAYAQDEPPSPPPFPPPPPPVLDGPMISGTVTDMGGNPLPSESYGPEGTYTYLQLWRSLPDGQEEFVQGTDCWWMFQACVGPDGNYYILSDYNGTALVPGKYRLEVYANDYEGSEKMVMITDGEDEIVNFKLVPLPATVIILLSPNLVPSKGGKV